MKNIETEIQVNDALGDIADCLERELKLRAAIDDWVYEQLGNTDEAVDKADEMFSTAIEIFNRIC